MQRVWLYVFLALSIFAIGLLLLPDSIYQSDQARTPTLDPLYGTVTAEMEDFYARNTVWAAKETATAGAWPATATEFARNPIPLLLTGTANTQGETITFLGGETATTEFLLSIDPLYVTATAFILHATETVYARSHDLSATQVIEHATGTAFAEKFYATNTVLAATDPAYITATASALQEMITLVPTSPEPTATATPLLPFTIEEFETLRAKYKSMFTSTLGFEHPIFDVITTELLVEMSNMHQRNDSLNIAVATTWFLDSKYVAAITSVSLFDPIAYRFFLFRVTDDVPTLLNDPTETMNYRLWFGGVTLLDFDGNLHMPDKSTIQLGFADRNKNGLPDIGIESSSGGNCCLPRLILYEIQENGNLADISPEKSDAYPNNFTDIENDGKLEMVGWSDFGLGLDQLYIRWWGWDGTAYVDISAQHPEFYMPEIERFLEVLETHEGCYAPDYSLAKVLLNYYALGRLGEVWPELKQKMGWYLCSVETIAEHGEKMLSLEKWVREHS